jgi:hypothetical protein
MQDDFQEGPTLGLTGNTSIKTMDIEPYRKIGNNKSLMDVLLFDQNTKSNLIWGTDDYESQGSGYGPRDPINYLYIINPNKIIRPRYLKSFSEQRNRSREMAEVFTPPWIVNKQNNLVDEQWTGKKNPFNVENDSGWTPTKRVDLNDRDWKDYVTSIRMEICCGEAPYLTTRYDSIDGTEIPVNRRVGILDRKLRVISENIESKLSWLDWAKAAVRSIYGYDFQGDNVLLARENVLLSIMESFRDKFGEDLPEDVAKDVCHILSWNIWQMDGMKMVVPFSCEKICSLDEKHAYINSCPACKSGKGRHTGKYCYIMDWRTDRTVEFASLMGKERTIRPKAASNSTLDSFWGENLDEE